MKQGSVLHFGGVANRIVSSSDNFTYKKENLVNRRNTILKEIETIQDVNERQNLEKELNDVIIQLAKMK